MKIFSKGMIVASVAALSLMAAACAPSEPENGGTPGAATGGGTPVATTAPGGAGTTGGATGAGAQTTPTRDTVTGGASGAQATSVPSGSTGAGATTPGTSAARTPTSEVRGVQATPGTAGTPGTVTPGARQEARTPAELLIDDLEAFNSRLDGLTGGGALPGTGQEPLPSDLPSVVEQATLLLEGISSQYDAMSSDEQEEALQMMADAVDKMSEVFDRYEENFGATSQVTPGTTGTPVAGAPTAVGTPTAVTGATGSPVPATRATGTPGTTVQGTPVAGGQQFTEQVEQIQDDITDLSGSQVTGQEISAVLADMQQVLDGMSRQPDQVQQDDLEALHQAMSDLVDVAESYAAEAYATTGTGASGTPAAGATTPATGVMGTPTPAAGGMATPSTGTGTATPGTMGAATPSPTP